MWSNSNPAVGKMIRMMIGGLAPARVCALAVLSPLILSACASGDLGPATALPTERYAIEVKSEPDELRLVAHPNGASANQAQALGAYAAAWRDNGGDPITIAVPSNGADPAAAYRTANDARDILANDGVSSSAVRIASYEPAAGQPAPIVITFDRQIAVGPSCGKHWEDLSSTVSNREFANFGCATTADMAAQMAYPRDVLSPEVQTPPDAARRQAVLDAYRKGQTTSSAKDAQASGAVSQSIQ